MFDSATHVEAYVAAHPTEGDIVVAASYAGVLYARLIMSARPRATIGLDCVIGKDGAGIAGLWNCEALQVPAAAADTMTAEMGNGQDLYDNGVLSRVNDCAQRLGLAPGILALEAMEPDGIVGASVDTLSARMGDGQNTYFVGVIGAANRHAQAKGVRVGQRAREAALRMLD